MTFDIFTTDPSFTSRGRTTASGGVHKKIEVVGALPGETVSLRLCGRSKRKQIGVVQEVLSASPLRVAPRCSHVPFCGGCSLQHLDYGAQVRLKREKIEKLFEGFNPTFHPIIPCETPWEYRNKMEFSFSEDLGGNQYLGLILGGSRGKVLNLKECHLVRPWMAQMLQSVRLFWQESRLHAYRIDNTGSFRTLTLREGMHTQEKMVILTVSGRPEYALSKKDIENFKQAVYRVLPEEVSIFLIIQQVAKGSPTQFFEIHLAGKDHILETMSLGQKKYIFKVSPTSFFQPNTSQAEKLYQRALELIQGSPSKNALDLFSGTATFSIFLAEKFEKVTAIEINPYAVLDAKINLETNGVSNVVLLQGDVAEKLKEVDEPMDVITLDPPRAGCGAQGLAWVLSKQPKTILYISCNPETQAEDVAVLVQNGYRLLEVQPVDQFPHTAHCENICVLHRA